MRTAQWFGILLLVVAVAVVGCGDGAKDKGKPSTGKSATTEEQDEVKASLAKLAPADRKLAEAQKDCPVSDEPLGSMRTPVKLTLDGETVFLCCSKCETKAKDNPAKIAARARELRAKNKSS
jgi:hypothetical protein